MKIIDKEKIKYIQIYVHKDEVDYEADYDHLEHIKSSAFILEDGSMQITYDFQTGEVLNVPKGYNIKIPMMKLVDEGVYRLLDAQLNVIASIDDGYVPNRSIPGSCGDYVNLNIEDSVVVNRLANPSFEEWEDVQ